MARFETQLEETSARLIEVLYRDPLLENPPLPRDWLKCEMRERYQVLRHAPFEEGMNVLEVGCVGHVISTVLLAIHAGERDCVVAVEPERWSMFREIVTRAGIEGQVRAVRADARRLPVIPGRLDLATCVHGLRSLRSEANMVRIFREMLRGAPRISLTESLPITRSDAQRADLGAYELREDYFQATTGVRDDLHNPSIGRAFVFRLPEGRACCRAVMRHGIARLKSGGPSRFCPRKMAPRQ